MLNVQLLSKSHFVTIHKLDGTRFGVPPSGGDRVNAELQTLLCFSAWFRTPHLIPLPFGRGEAEKFVFR